MAKVSITDLAAGAPASGEEVYLPGQVDGDTTTKKYNGASIVTDWEPTYSFRRYVTAAQWQDILSGVSTTSLSVELQEAEDDVNSKGGGIIHYPPGTIPINGYKGSQTSYDDNRKGGLYLMGKVHHRGVPGKTVWKNISDNWRCMVRIRQGDNWSFYGITFDGDRYNHTPVLLATDDVRGEIFILGDEVSPITNGKIINCRGKNSGHYFIGVQNLGVDGLLVEDNYAYDIGGDGIDIKDWADWPKKGVIVRNNRFGKIGTYWQKRVADGDGPQAAFDLRGAILAEGNTAFDIDTYDATQLGNDGLRVNSDVPSNFGRLGGRKTRLVNNFVYGSKLDSEGSDTAKRTRGLVIQAPDVSAVNTYVEGCYIGGIVALGGDGGASGQPDKTHIAGLTIKNAKGATGTGVGLQLGSGAVGHKITAVIEGCDTGFVNNAQKVKADITFKGNTVNHTMTADGLRQNGTMSFTYLDGAAGLTDDKNSFVDTLKVWSQKTPWLIIGSTYNANDWPVPYSNGGILATKEDTSGLGAGIVGKMEFRYAGASAANGGWGFSASDGTTGLIDIAWLNYQYAYFYKPVVMTKGGVPTALSDAGVEGQMVFDDTGLYLATSPNLWKKIPLTPVGGLSTAESNVFGTRSELSGAKLAYGTSIVTVARYASGGPLVNMVYSINDTDQSSTDPTSMSVSVISSTGTVTTKYTKLISPRVTPAMMGAPIDGSSDDMVAANRAVTYFKVCYGDRGVSAYIVKSPIKMVANSILDMTDGPVLKVDLTTAFNNATTANQYTDSAAVIQAKGSTSGTDTPLDNVKILGCKIVPITTVEQRRTNVICAINCTNLVIKGNDISGFCVGAGVSINSCAGGVQDYQDNYVHDWYSNYAWGDAGVAQATGIVVDADRVHGGKDSKRCSIVKNRIINILKGSTAIAAVGYQTDGVNICGNSSTKKFHVISENIISGVDEGIDNFAKSTRITNNTIDTVSVGVKLIHGACGCLVEGNTVEEATLWGMTVVSSADGDVKDNQIVGNRVHMAGGSTVGTVSCLYVAENGGGYVCDNNTFRDNVWDGNGVVAVNIHNEVTTGVNRSVGDSWLSQGTSSTKWVDGTSTKFLIERPVKRTRAVLNLASNWDKTGATEEKLPFNTVVVDDRAEYDGVTTNSIVVTMPGYYNIKLSLASSTWPANNRCLIRLYYKKSSSTYDIFTHRFQDDYVSDQNVLVAYDHFYLPEGAEVFARIACNSSPASTLTIYAATANTFLAIEKA